MQSSFYTGLRLPDRRPACLALLLGILLPIAAADGIDPRQVLGDRRFAPVHHAELVPQLLALDDGELGWFLDTGSALAVLTWEENIAEQLDIPWQQSRRMSVEYTLEPRFDLVGLLLACLEACDDKQLQGLPNGGIASLGRLLCREIHHSENLIPHAYASDLLPGGRQAGQAERRDGLRRRWVRQCGRWPDLQLDAWVHRVLDDPTTSGLLTELPRHVTVDPTFEAPLILGHGSGVEDQVGRHITLAGLPDLVIRIALAAPDATTADLPTACQEWWNRTRASQVWSAEEWNEQISTALSSEMTADDLARWAALAGAAEPERVAAVIPLLTTAAVAQNHGDPAWADGLAPAVIALHGPAGLRAWLDGIHADLRAAHGAERAEAWSLACFCRPRLLPAALGGVSHLTGLPAEQIRLLNRRLTNLFRQGSYRRHADQAWFFIAASPLADPGPRFDPCLFEGARYIRFDEAFVYFPIADCLPDWHRRGDFLESRLSSLPDGLGKTLLTALCQPDERGCGVALNALAATQEQLPGNQRERILDEMRHVIGGHLAYGVIHPPGLDAGGQQLFTAWFQHLNAERRDWAADFFAAEGPFDPRTLASWTEAIAAADPGLALRLLQHAGERASDGPRRPNLPLLRETIERLWAEPAPEADAVVLRLLADPATRLLLLPDEDWAGQKAWSDHAKKLDGGLPALVRDLHGRWRRLLPDHGLAPLLPCLVDLLDQLAAMDGADAIWLDELAATADRGDLQQLWFLAADCRRLRALLDQGARDATVAQLASDIAAWYRTELAAATSPCLRLFIAAQAADQQLTWALVDGLERECLADQALPGLLQDLLDCLQLGQAWPIPAGDALWDRLVAAASEADFTGPVAAWLAMAQALRTDHPASAARSYRIRDSWARVADDDQHRLLAGLFRIALHRNDQPSVQALAGVHDQILLRSSGIFADLVRHAEPAAVAHLFSAGWPRIDREPFAAQVDATLLAALPAVLDLVADADQRLLLRCMLESLPSTPRPDQRRGRMLRDRDRLPADPERARRVAGLAATVRDHTFADPAIGDRCLWFLMGLGDADRILVDAIATCARRIGYAGLEDLQDSDPWAFRMGYWCLRDSLVRAGEQGDGDALLALIATAEGVGRTELGYHQRDLQNRLLAPDCQAAWQTGQWQSLGRAGRQAVDWYLADRLWTAKRIWHWVVPVSLVSGELDALADWLARLPDPIRREMISDKRLQQLFAGLHEKPDVAIKAQLGERIQAWLAHDRLRRLLPVDLNLLAELVAWDQLSAEAEERFLTSLAGNRQGEAWAAIAARQQAAGRISQAIESYEAAAKLGRKRDRRDWQRAADRLRDAQRKAAEAAAREREQAAERAREAEARANREAEARQGEREAEATPPPSDGVPSADGF